MSHFRQVARGVDMSGIRAVLNLYPELWTGRPLSIAARSIERQVRPGDLSVDGKHVPGWEAIFLRWQVNQTLEFRPEIESSAYWARDTLRTIASLIDAREIGYIMLLRLRAGCHVPSHMDGSEYSRQQRFDRFHCALASNPNCWCESGGEKVHMAPGELWWFDHRAEHSVSNDGVDDRIHLIFDAKAAP